MISARCSSGVFFSCCVQCFSEPLQRRFIHTAAGTLNPIDRSMPVEQSRALPLYGADYDGPPSRKSSSRLQTHRPTHAPKQPPPGLPLNLLTVNGRSNLVSHEARKILRLVCSPSTERCRPCISYFHAFFSHSSILSLLLNKKSISSNPFIKQSFL